MRALKAAGCQGTVLSVRRASQKKVVQPSEIVTYEERTVRHIVRVSHNKIADDSRKYNYPVFQTAIDHRSAALIMSRALVDRSVWEIIGRSRFLTPNVSTMISNLIKFDQPDVPCDRETSQFIALAQHQCRQDEMGVPTVVWSSKTYTCFSVSVLDAFPGLSYRRMGRDKKKDVDILASADGYAARQRIMRNKDTRDLPCALFGRGKIVGGIEPGVPQGGAGRLVMAPDGRDHLIMAPEAAAMMDCLKTKWQTRHIMMGVSFPNCGAAAFCGNIACDLLGIPRICDESDVKFHNRAQIDMINRAFNLHHQNDYRYYVLDVSKQDTTISRMLLDYYFDALFFSVRAYGKNQMRLSRILAWQKQFHANTLLCLPDGSLWRKHRGNVSGSPHTTLINSWSQNLCVRSALLFIFGGKLPAGITWRVYGDNTFVAVHKRYADKCSMANLTDVLVEMFEMKINEEESYEADGLFIDDMLDPTRGAAFLGKRFYTNGLVWRPVSETLTALIHPDSKDVSNNAVLSRANGLAMDNPGNYEAQYVLNYLMDDLSARGARIIAPSRLEMQKMIYGRGFSLEEATIPFRMRPKDVRLLYTTCRGDPTRDKFVNYDCEFPDQSEMYGITRGDLESALSNSEVTSIRSGRELAVPGLYEGMVEGGRQEGPDELDQYYARLAEWTYE